MLGHASTTIVKSVTDNTREELKVKEEISITGVLPCDVPNLFYHPNGELIKDKLNEILGNQKKNVVAWFKYKKFRKQGFKFTIRERVLHEELTNYLNMSPYLFTCCLLTKSQSVNRSTQIFSHAFINMYESNFKMLPMHIKNLGDSCHVYQPNVKPSESFMKLYSKIKKDQSDLEIGQDIFKSIKRDLGNSISELESSEAKLWELKKEVNDLKKKILKSVLSGNKIPSGEMNNEISDLDKMQIEVPLSPENLPKSLPDSQVENELVSSTAVVDLTFSEEDEDEDLSRKTKVRDRRK